MNSIDLETVDVYKRDLLDDLKEHYDIRDDLKSTIEFSLDKLRDPNVITDSLRRTYEELILNDLLEVKKVDSEIRVVHKNSAFYKVDTTLYVKELHSQRTYEASVKDRLRDKKGESSDCNPADTRTPSTTYPFPGSLQALPPTLRCGNFSGDTDRENFRTFLKQFSNLIDSRSDFSPAAKLQYLQGYLRGPALHAIQHLTFSDENYPVALDILKKEFLDIPQVIETLLRKIVHHPKVNPNKTSEIRNFISDIRATFFELKSLGRDLFAPEIEGCGLASVLLFDKLPHSFREQLKIRVREDHPTIFHLFDNYTAILKGWPPETLSSTSSSYKTDKSRFNSKFSKDTSQKSIFTNHSQSRASEKGSQADDGGEGKKGCKLCLSMDHRITRCSVYQSFDERKNQCETLGLCAACSSSKHTAKDCPGKKLGLSRPCFSCNSKKHISALCPKLVRESDTTPSSTSISNPCFTFTNLEEAPVLLPTISLPFRVGGNVATIRCLIDSASQRSYVRPEVLSALKVTSGQLPSRSFTVKTFLGTAERTVRECGLEVEGSPGIFRKVTFLVDKDVSLDFKIPGLRGALMHFILGGIRLADSNFKNLREDAVRGVHCLLGADVLGYLRPSFVEMKGGFALKTGYGLCPFGDISLFLTPSQRQLLIPQSSPSEGSSSQTA